MNKQMLIIFSTIFSDDIQTTMVLSIIHVTLQRTQHYCTLFISATIPVFSIIYTTSHATDHKSPHLKSSLASTHASRSCLTACHCYSIVHYIKKSEISLVILPCTGKQEQLINLRRQSYPLNIKYHPSPGTTLMRRK